MKELSENRRPAGEFGFLGQVEQMLKFGRRKFCRLQDSGPILKRNPRIAMGKNQHGSPYTVQEKLLPGVFDESFGEHLVLLQNSLCPFNFAAELVFTVLQDHDNSP